ncbi:mucosa-associated lymphoid tissue lymphoma translocation protein 1-like isoform X2 [Centruroides sculpturatus]|uniref:mucosa-associated lymphoid tissue lymphoma translocation protein 1-like isoform X2 n=1 Tax=Centruroides sculpturatus TaxID=218467 RepID=UPI000C6D5EA6|nr:mucosa-associated lymphoid tissue lymphoma translocation protein 1-like isoform X2 [Centruroides sculpturatus]
MMNFNYVKDVDPGIIYRIQLLLSVDDKWKKLLNVSSIDREKFNNYVEKLEYKEDMLFARTVLDFCENIPIDDFIFWLEEISLEEALLMLKKDEPLEIIERPKKLITVDADQQEEIILSCKAKGFPTPKYLWYHNNVPLLEGSVLKLSAELKNNGCYYCEIYNISRSRIKTFLRTSKTEVIISKNEKVYNGNTDEVDHQTWDEKCSASDKCDSATSSRNEEMECENVTYFDKFALLIGINKYEHFTNLNQATQDVCDLSKLLKTIGFKTFLFQNLTRKEIIEAVNLFCTFLRPGTYSLFYFAGHGFEQPKQCYLLPKDAKMALPKESINVDFVVKCLQERTTAMNLILFDICRSLPDEYLEGKSNLGRVFNPQPSRNTVIGYATSYACSCIEIKNRSSIYVQYLKKYITKPLSVWEMLRKVNRDIEKDSTVNSKQYPNISGNLTRPLKLTDKINGQGDKLFEMESKRWEILTGAPEDLIFKCGKFNLILKFVNYQNFSNVLQACFYMQVLSNEAIDDYEGVLEFPDRETELDQKNDKIDDTHKLCCSMIIFNIQQQVLLKGSLKVTKRNEDYCFEKNICIPLPLAQYMRKHLYKKHEVIEGPFKK